VNSVGFPDSSSSFSWDAAPFFVIPFFLCISSLHFTGSFLFFFCVKDNNDVKWGGTFFFLSMIETFSMEQNECQKWGEKKGPYYLSSSFWLCRTETWRLLSITDNYPRDSLIFWQRYLRSRSIKGLTKILFDFFILGL
jgi:hypothetical protein